jgi:hypothetical protein
VVVHGAFADGSSWNAVIERLPAKGVRPDVRSRTDAMYAEPAASPRSGFGGAVSQPGAAARAIVEAVAAAGSATAMVA